MVYNKLGRTGLDCSKLGFGTWQIGGGRWKGMSDDESISLLRKAKQFGINIFDAAVVYGQYRGEYNEKRSHSLELLGKAFPKEKRNEIIICLKIGQIDEYSHRAFYKPDRLVKQIRQALIQLDTDYRDICLIHAPSLSEVISQQALRVIQTLRALGLVKFIGYSFEDEPENAKIAIDQDIDVLMLQYNLIDTSCSEIFNLAERKGVGVLVGGPLKRGYLNGEFEKISDFPTEDDYWNWNLRYSRKKVEQTLQKVNDLKAKYGDAKHLREKAFDFINCNHGVSSIIVGHRKELEVEENSETFIKINKF
jgi:aryl-alcohol dehydrogenase-like predicted oxidoreductase